MPSNEQVRKSHLDLSPVAERFLDFALSHPACRQKIDFLQSTAPSWIDELTYPMQTWPTFVGPEKMQVIERATTGVTELVRKMPQRIFDLDPKRIAQFAGQDNALMVAMHMEPPDGLAVGLARNDYIDSEKGFYCLEVNFAANIGGWQIRFWQELCRTNPPVAEFLQQEGLDPTYQDPLLSLLRFLADQAEPLAGGGAVNLAFVITQDFYRTMGPAAANLNDLYRQILAERGREGTIHFCTYPQGLSARRGVLYHQDSPVQAVVEYSREPTPPDVYRCFKAESIRLFNSPLCGLLDNKRNLALLSEHEESDAFTAEERRLIRDHIPWTRDVVPGTTRYQGEKADLKALLLGKQRDFVLKPIDGTQGQDVFVGPFVDPTAWQRQVEFAFRQKQKWIAQEMIPSRPYLYQSGDDGTGVHDVVWGMFSFGTTYGGGFLRMIPQDTHDGVINAARGATEGFIFEV